MSEALRFLNICACQRGFNIRKKGDRLRQSAFPGLVVASAEAAYFVPDVKGLHRSPFGDLFGSLLRTPKLGDLGGRWDLSELPAEITGHPDWPVTWNEGPVFVVPREAVMALRTSFLTGGIEMELPEVRVLVFTPIFRRKQMAAYLAALGWPIAGIGNDDSLVPKANMGPNRPTARAVQKRKQAVRAFVLGVILVLASLGILFWQLTWVKSAIAGPMPVTAAELRQLSDPGAMSNPWVSFTYDRSIDTETGVVSTGILETILGNGRSRYLLIEVQDCWLIVEVPENHSGNRVTGCVETWSTPLRREALEEVHSRFPGHRMLPFQLNAHYPYRRECFALLGVVAFLFLAGAYLIVRGRALHTALSSEDLRSRDQLDQTVHEGAGFP